MSPKPKYFRTLAEGRKALESVGIDPGHMTMAEMAVSYQQQLKRNAIAAKSVAPKAAIKAAVDAIGSLKTAIKAEKNIGSKISLLEDLRAKLLADMSVAKDHASKTAITREFMATEKKIAYARLAEKTLDPKASKARRLLDLADQD
jgi:hypothetical protein